MRSIAMVWLATLALPARAEPPTWSLELLEGVLRPFDHRSVGDLDGDGLDDGVYVGYARVHVRLGRGRPAPDPTEAPDWAHDYPMPVDGDVLTMAPAGDVDGDGLADFAIGVVNRHPAGAGSDFLDYVVVRHGAKHPVIVSPTPWVVADDTPGTRFGSALAAGDLNGDGFTDLAIGAPGDPLDPLAIGHVVVHLGSPIGLEARQAVSLAGAAGYGAALAILDHDGDGQADLLVGGPDGVELHRGQRRVNDAELDLAPLDLAPRRLTPSPVSDPQALFGAGDLDGDGLADAVRVDVPGNRIDLFFGGTAPEGGRTVTIDLSVWGPHAAQRHHAQRLRRHRRRARGRPRRRRVRRSRVQCPHRRAGPGRSDRGLRALRRARSGSGPPCALRASTPTGSTRSAIWTATATPT
jgi:hypothetical protein